MFFRVFFLALPFTITAIIKTKQSFDNLLMGYVWFEQSQFKTCNELKRHSNTCQRTIWHLPRQFHSHTLKIPKSQGKRESSQVQQLKNINPNITFFPLRILSYLVSQRLRRLNLTTSAAVASSSSPLVTPSWSQVAVGLSQELRDGVAKSFKVCSNGYFQMLHVISYSKSKVVKQSLFVSATKMPRLHG